MIKAPRFGTGIGLRRVAAALDALGVDHQRLSSNSINITGSNGKGSTAAITSEIALAHGLKTGLFTSPHLYRFNERYKIDGAVVADREIEQALVKVQAAADRVRLEGEEFGGFELLFAAAVVIFEENGCDLCVFEAGIGGRYDPVRLTGARTAAVTSVDLEHTSVLGDSLELICLDKTDICARGGTVFYGLNCESLSPLLRTYCSLNGIEPAVLGYDIPLEIAAQTAEGTEFILGGNGAAKGRYTVPMLGAHQANNAALSLLLFENWSRQHGEQIAFSTGNAHKGLAAAKWPGRLETINSDPLTVIDVGHTPDGIKAALEGLKAALPQHEFVLVTGVSFDKDAEAILRILAPSFKEIVCTKAYQRGRPPAEIAELAGKINPSALISSAETIEQALEQSIARAGSRCGIYVAGGMYIAAEYAAASRGEDPRELPHLF